MNAYTLATALSSLLFCTASFAQTYRCTSGTGTYFSDRPCNTAPRTQLGAYGPARSAPDTYRSNVAPLPKQAEHVRYLGSECASLNDAIRTAPTRGVGHATISDLRTEYDQRCRDDDAEARRRLAQSQSEERDKILATRAANQQEQLRAQMEAQRCGDLRQIIQSKRSRAQTLSPGEVAELHRSEENYNLRCLRK